MTNFTLFDKIIQALNNVCNEFCENPPLSENHVQERPICYEFYHQFKKLDVGELITKGIVLVGEPDKGYQKRLAKEVRKKPDFILHTPDTDDNNTAVLEFKKFNSYTEIYNDLSKLLNFKNNRDLKYTLLVEVIILHRKLKMNLKKRLKEEEIFQNSTINIIILDGLNWYIYDTFVL